MFNLLYKELRLAAHPNLFVFTLLGALVLVPSYPYGMVFLFGCLAPYITFMYGRETNDIIYTVLLPIRKRDIVKAKCMLVVCAQMAQILISLPFAVLRLYLLPDPNPAGIEANVAFYGIGLLTYAIFDCIFLTQFFQTAFKAGRAFLLAVIPAALVVTGMEAATFFPSLAWLDSTTPDMLLRQLPILLTGAVIYAATMLVTYRVAAARFERVDL